MTNKVIRQCDRCKNTADQETHYFSYIGDGDWACNNCYCKWTTVVNVYDTKEITT